MATECEHLMPSYLCRVCSAEYWKRRVTITGRLGEPPERQFLRPALNHMVQSQNAEIMSADFAKIERRVVARYRPKTIFDE
jgi:hypothetical protein